MKTYLIGYDLNRPRGEDDYTNLITAIKGLCALWWHYLDSTWIVTSNLASTQIRDELKKYIDSGDELLVVGLAGDGAWTGFNQQASDWLLNNL